MTDFQVGEPVVCVRTRGVAGVPFCPTVSIGGLVGKIFRINKIVSHPSWPVLGLSLDGFPPSSHPDGLWAHVNFRKLRAADEQFIQQMRALKPVKVPSHVE